MRNLTFPVLKSALENAASVLPFWFAVLGDLLTLLLGLEFCSSLEQWIQPLNCGGVLIQMHSTLNLNTLELWESSFLRLDPKFEKDVPF